MGKFGETDLIYQFADGYFVRTLSEDDLVGPYLSWFEDQIVTRYSSHGKYFKNSAWLRESYSKLNTNDQILWAVCHKIDGHIGNITLQSISTINRSAEFAIIIGNTNHWRKSVAYNSSLALFSHGFFKLNLNRIYCGTAGGNVGMQRLAKKLGMRKEGQRRKHLFLDGCWDDVVEFGILREEFIAINNK